VNPSLTRKTKQNETMTHTHTPGPWKIDGNYILSGCGNYHLSLMTMIDEDMDDEWKANARLISAAPDLLEALEGLLHGSRKVTSQEDWNAEREEASATARAAIAKATGKGDA